MRKFFAIAVGSAVALVGFAGAANATATVDLIWAATGTPLIGDPDTSVEVGAGESIVLNVILTAGAENSNGGAISADYSTAVGKLTVLGATNNDMSAELPINFEAPRITGSRVEGINASCLCPFIGTGLVDGQSALLGTVTFLKSALALNGTFEIRADINSTGDGVIAGDGTPVAVTNFNSAFLINVPEPGALSLLILALGGLGLVGRGRRS